MLQLDTENLAFSFEQQTQNKSFVKYHWTKFILQMALELQWVWLSHVTIPVGLPKTELV